MLLNNRFETIKEIGSGGMGKVYLAEDLKLKRKVAIKIISENSITDTTSKARFLREAQTASSLDHSNICTIYEIYNEQKEEYIVMQYIDGITIDQIINIKKLSINKIIDIAVQICDGMIEAHTNGVIHRDIKPSNIIIDKKGVVKILDFGLAKFDAGGAFSSEQNTNITEQGMVLGTVSYMSPEQAQGDVIDKRTDIFSFGTVLFEMIDGYNPFLSEHKIETLYNVTSLDIKFKRNIPEELKNIVGKALNKNKKNRYSCFEDIRNDLYKIRDNLDKEPEFYEKLSYSDSSETELINTDGLVINPMKNKTSDNEALGDIVNRIRKYKGSTEAVLSGTIKKKKSILLLFMLVLLVSFLFFIIFKKSSKIEVKNIPDPVKLKQLTYVKLRSFEDLSEKKELLDEKINYLLIEFLNQSDKLRVVSDNVLERIKKNGNNNKIIESIEYELLGKISSKNNIYTIDAKLILIKTNEIKKRFTKTGVGKNSILLNQIDSLVTELSKYLSDKTEAADNLSLKKVIDIYGKEWTVFDRFYKGLSLYKKLDIAKSIEVFETINNNPIAEYYLANLYYFNGDKKKAQLTINKIIPFADKMTESIRNRVLAFKAQLDHNFSQQIKYLNSLKEKFPFSKEIFYEIGEAYFHHGEADNAIINYKKALLLDKNYSQAINHLGYCYSYMGEHEKALEQFQLYRAKDNFSANSLDSLGDGYFYKGELNDSLSMKNSAVNLDPKGVTWAYLTIADILILQARYSLALENIDLYSKTLLSLNKLTDRDRAEILTKKAYISYLENDFKTGKLQLKNSIDLFNSEDIIDNNAETHWLSGIIAIETDNIKKAEEELDWLKKIIDRYKISKDNYYDPLKYYLHLNSLVLEIKGNLIDAENEYKKLIEIKTQLSYWITYYNYQFFYNEYIRFLNRNTRYEKAQEEIEKCLKFSNLYIPVLWQKALVFDRTNNKEATKIYRKIKDLYTDDTGKILEKNLLRAKIKKMIREN